MDERSKLKETYQLISKLFSYPEELHPEEIERSAAEVAVSLAGEVGEEPARALVEFARESRFITPDEYIETLELNPKCPLYLGCYSCNGGPDGRKRREFMCEVIDVYRFYGLMLEGREYPDFLPVMVEALWVSIDAEDLRPRDMLIRQYILPALPKLEAELEKVGSPYARLVCVLGEILEFDLETISKEDAKHDVPT